MCGRGSICVLCVSMRFVALHFSMFLAASLAELPITDWHTIGA